MASEWIGPFNLVISNGVLQNSSDVFHILDPDVGGASTFSVPLSADGSQPPTHWGCRTPLKQATFDALRFMSNPDFMDYVNDLAAALGRTPVGSVTAFKNSLQMTTDPSVSFWDFIASIGLQTAYPPSEE